MIQSSSGFNVTAVKQQGENKWACWRRKASFALSSVLFDLTQSCELISALLLVQTEVHSFPHTCLLQYERRTRCAGNHRCYFLLLPGRAKWMGYAKHKKSLSFLTYWIASLTLHFRSQHCKWNPCKYWCMFYKTKCQDLQNISCQGVIATLPFILCFKHIYSKMSVSLQYRQKQPSTFDLGVIAIM